MDLEKELTDEYLDALKIRFNEDGYTNLSSNQNRQEIKETIFNSLGKNGYDKTELFDLVDLYDRIIFGYLDSEMSQGARPFRWTHYLEDNIRGRLKMYSGVNSSPPTI